MSVYLGTNCIDYLKINKKEEKTVKFIDYDGTILHEYSKSEFLDLSSMPSNPSTSIYKSLVGAVITTTCNQAGYDDTIHGTTDNYGKITFNVDTFVGVWESDYGDYANLIVNNASWNTGEPAGFMETTWDSATKSSGIWQAFHYESDTFSIGNFTYKLIVDWPQGENPTGTLQLLKLQNYLIPQGWNWSLSDAKDYVEEWGYLNIGQMYITQSGDTEIDIEFPENSLRLSPYLCIYIYGEVDIDWGDNSTHTVVTVTSTTSQEKILHNYAQPGNYTIKIHVNSGSFAFFNNTTTDCRILSADKASYADLVYSNTIKAIRIGENCNIRYCGFSSLFSLKSITIPKNILAQDNFSYAFHNCYSLQSITIPDTVTYIKNNAIKGCYSLQSITIPNSVTKIDNGVFSGCYSLRSFIMPSSLTDDCYIDLSDGAVFIKIIPSSNINFHTNGLDLSIPSGVTSIDSYAFHNCYSLQSITIPDTVTSISNYAFSGCSSLQSIMLSNSVTTIYSSAFSGCSSLQSITLPNTVTSIGSYAFNDCYSLQSITIPYDVTTFNDSVFRDCYSLQSIEIPDTITSIKSYSFYNCYCIQSVTIPDGVTSIGSYAFDYCHSLQSITIPNTVTSIGVGAFYNCYGLKECHLKSTTPPALSGSVFTNIPSDFILYVPQGSLSAYQSATNWSTYASYMQEETN